MLAGILTIQSPQTTGVFVIPVAGEKMQDKSVMNIKIIKDEKGIEYEMLDFLMFPKDGIFPTALMLLATGQNITKQWCYDGYPDSDRIYFLIIKRK